MKKRPWYSSNQLSNRIRKNIYHWWKTELRYWRESSNISQRQMAEWLGTSRSTYRRFEEKLHRKAPRDKGLEFRASELTGIPMSELHYTYNESNLGTQTRADDRVGFSPYDLKNTLILDKEEKTQKRKRQRLESNYWRDLRETEEIPEWQEIELDRVEWAAVFETIRQQRRQRDRKQVSDPRNFEDEVKDAIENYLSRRPLTVLEYNRLDRFWSQQKVATQIGISQSQYSKIERRICKAADAELDKLERLFGISKKASFYDGIYSTQTYIV